MNVLKRLVFIGVTLAQAKSKTPLGEATDATPQPSRVGNPFIVSPR